MLPGNERGGGILPLGVVRGNQPLRWSARLFWIRGYKRRDAASTFEPLKRSLFGMFCYCVLGTLLRPEALEKRRSLGDSEPPEEHADQHQA